MPPSCQSILLGRFITGLGKVLVRFCITGNTRTCKHGHTSRERNLLHMLCRPRS
jgi:hypothetical protein